MKKITISSTDLAYIFEEKLKTFRDCSPRTTIAIVPSKNGWNAVTNAWSQFKNPLCQNRIALVQKQLREIYVLAKD